MKKPFVYLALALLASPALNATENAIENAALIDETRAAMKALGAELKATLQSTMKSDGPLKAISVCNEKAPELAQKISAEKGMEVGRTSLRTRNELNAPDPWELSVLEQFEHRKAEGEPVAGIEYSEITTLNGSRVFRYMKAIPADDVCLICHGKQIADNLSAEINKLYSNDRATGFGKGDIRGAFSVTKTLE